MLIHNSISHLMFNSHSYIHIEAGMETREAHHDHWGGERRGQACCQLTCLRQDPASHCLAKWGSCGPRSCFCKGLSHLPGGSRDRRRKPRLVTWRLVGEPGVPRKGWAQSWADVGHRRQSTTWAWKMSGTTIILVLAGLG